MNKFRVWGPRGKRWLDASKFAVDGDGDLMEDIGGSEGWCYTDDDDEVILLYYTGIDDGYEQPIYEGDILEIASEKYYGKPSKFPTTFSVVRYEYGSFLTTKGQLRKVVNRSVVRGNIYDNPELLN